MIGLGAHSVLPFFLSSVHPLSTCLFSFLFLAVMHQLHTVAIAVHNALFQTNKLVMESRIMKIK